MNFLGFILALFLIFSIMTNFMLKQHKDTIQLKRSMEGYYRAYKLSQNSIQDFIYKNHKGKKESKNNKIVKNQNFQKKKKRKENNIKKI